MTAAGRARVRLSVAQARELALTVVCRMGYSDDDAAIVADHVIDAALCGYEYSGLPKLLDAIEDKRSSQPRSPILTLRETSVSVLFDGGNNLGMLTMVRLAEAVASKARATGFAIGGLMNSWMSGRGAHYVERLARTDLVAIHTVSVSRRVAPPGGAEPFLGTNPLTVGLPSAGDPLILDIGTSAITYSDVALHARRSEPLPEGVAIDAQGGPTRDPHRALSGALLPFGGHKGFGLGLVIHGLGLLAGAGRSPGKDYGFLLIAFSPDLLIPVEEYKQEVADLIRRVKATRRQPGVDSIRIPSERSFRERERNMREGIEIDAAIHEELLRQASR